MRKVILLSFTLVLHCMWGLPELSSALGWAAWELLFWENRSQLAAVRCFLLTELLGRWRSGLAHMKPLFESSHVLWTHWWAVVGWVIFSCPDQSCWLKSKLVGWSGTAQGSCVYITLTHVQLWVWRLRAEFSAVSKCTTNMRNVMVDWFAGSGESQLLSERADANFYLHVPVNSTADLWL